MIWSSKTAVKVRERLGRLVHAGFGSTSTLALVILVCVVIPASFVAMQIHDNPRLGPIDEAQHLDYVMRVSKFEMPRAGQFLTQRDLRIIACTKIYNPYKPPPCDSPRFNPKAFPGAGYQYEALQPPAYYAATAIMRAVNEHVLGISNYLTSTRLTGIIWLCVGLLLLWFAGRLFEVDRWGMLAALLLLAVAPNVVYYASVVSNDAASVFAGALLALVTGLALARPSRATPWILAGAAFVTVALKTTNLIAVGALALFLLVRQVLEHPDWRSQLRENTVGFLRTGGALVVGGGVSLVGWLLATKALDLVSPTFLARFVGNPFNGGATIGKFFGETTAVLSLVTGSTPQNTYNYPIQELFIGLTAALFLTAGLAGLVAKRSWSTVLGLSTMVALLAGGLGIGVSVYLSTKNDPQVVSRYALCAAPVLALCIGNGARTWIQRLGVTAVAFGMFASTLYAFSIH